MSAKEMILTLRRIDKLIRTKSTGTPVEFARKLSLSTRSMYYYLSLMNDLGARIRYSRSTESYLYYEDGEFIVGFIKKYEDLNYAV